MAEPDRVGTLAGRVAHCIAAPPHVSLRAVSQLMRLVASLSRNTTQQTSSLRSRYNILYHDIVPQPGCACARCRSCRAFLSAVLQALPGHIVGVAGRVVAQPLASLRCQALLCHNTISCIVTQHQTWAVAHPTAFLSKKNFFTSFFFSFQLLENLPKKFFFFQFLVNQINLLKFILSIFFQFYTL